MTTTAPFGTRGERLAPYTSLRIGGPADFFLRVANEGDLAGAITVAREHESQLGPRRAQLRERRVEARMVLVPPGPTGVQQELAS